MFLIRDERDGELVLVAKFLLGLQRVGGDAEHGSAGGREGFGEASEVDRLAGTARRIGTGVEEQDQFAAGIVRQCDGVAAIARQAEAGGLLAFGQAGLRPSGWGRRFGRI